MSIRLVVAALAACPGLLVAQTIRGTVTEGSSQRPIPGAVVFLIDANQAVVARDLTNESGAYRLTAPRSGTYRVRTMRIGVKPTTSAPQSLAADQDITLPLIVESIPVNLSEVRVERRSNCAPRGDVTPAYNAWNEVATALNAALLSSTRMRGVSATVVAYDRWTQPGSDVILRQGANVRQGMTSQPWRSVGADSLHRAGFVVREPTGWYTFHALDIQVLLSETFLEDHCLELSDIENGEISVEFTPSRDRGRIAEVRGFVWLDARTLDLKRLQFRYVNVLRQYEQADAGGDLEFLRLRNGLWLISKWQIRMPTSFRQRRSDSYAGMSATPELYPTEVKTTGGDVLRILHNGDTLWSLPSRTFAGRVLDSTSSRPVPGARVAISGTAYSAVTNANGRFSIGDVLPGAYQVRVFTPDLDSLAGYHRANVIFVEQLADRDIRIPNRDQALAQWCPDATRAARESGQAGFVAGVIRNLRDTTPIANVEVAVEWKEGSVGQSGVVVTTARTAKVETDADGVYRACGPAVDRPITITTAFDGSLPPLETRIGASRTRRVDFWVRDGQRVADSTAISAAAKAQELKPVEVSAHRVAIREFEERRAFGIGQFMTRAELEKQESRKTGDVLSRMPGAHVARAGGDGSAWLATGRHSGSGRTPSGDAFDRRRGAKPACYADVWVDNTMVYAWRVGEPLFDVNSLQPSQIEAIEFYSSPATTPARYLRGGSPQCGALIIWTRR